jgi:hypothetical protein
MSKTGGKLLNIKIDIVEVLDAIKEERGGSYSDAIETLLQHRPKELWIEDVNHAFYLLEGKFPDMVGVFETMRVITIHFQRMPAKVKAIHLEELSEQLQKVLKYILSKKTKEEEVEGNKNVN